MFIKTSKSGYTRDGSQFAHGYFLILLCKAYNKTFEYRAIVRYVRMSHLGHWMMGKAKIGQYWLTLSGSYGSDGLPCNMRDSNSEFDQKYYPNEIKAHEEIWSRAIPVPDHLIELWNKGGGHNSAGSEVAEMKKWALKNLNELRGLTKAKQKC